jgi:hypothetical protein
MKLFDHLPLDRGWVGIGDVLNIVTNVLIRYEYRQISAQDKQFTDRTTAKLMSSAAFRHLMVLNPLYLASDVSTLL